MQPKTPFVTVFAEVLRRSRAGALPANCRYVRNLCIAFDKALKRAMDARGEISLTGAAGINSAMRWERHALLAQRWLRIDAENMTCDQKLSFSREIARESSERDKCIRALRLDEDTKSTLDALYAASATVLPAPSAEPAGATTDQGS